MQRLRKEKFFKFRGKVIGVLKLNRVFITHRTKEHWFRKFNGLGVSTQILLGLKKYECRNIKILYHTDDGGTDIYEAHPDTFLEKGVIYFDGTDSQRILNNKHFKITKGEDLVREKERQEEIFKGGKWK